jgi:hypothetical protein
MLTGFAASGVGVWLIAASASMAADTGMKFTLTIAKNEFRAGAPIPFTWKLTNDTGRSWFVYRELIGAGYEQIFLGIDGPSGKKIVQPASLEVAASSVSACWLPPGKTLEGTFDLSTWAEEYRYKMPPGLYRIAGTFDHSRARWHEMLVGRSGGVCDQPESPLKKALAGDIPDVKLSAPPVAFTLK